MRLFNRLLVYVSGLFIMALGVAFATNSNLGVSPVSSVPSAVSAASGISMGTCIIAVYSFYVLVQIILLRREFHPKNLLQVVFSTMFGYFVDFTRFLLGGFELPGYLGQLVMMAISMVLVAFGLVFYLTADIVPMPMEGMVLAITKKLPRSKFHNVKMICDITSVCVAACISVLGLGYLVGVREGTVIAALFIGRIMAFLTPRLRPAIYQFCFGQAEAIQVLPQEPLPVLSRSVRMWDLWENGHVSPMGSGAVEAYEIWDMWERSGVKLPQISTIEAKNDVDVWELWENGHMNHMSHGVYEMWEMWEKDGVKVHRPRPAVEAKFNVSMWELWESGHMYLGNNPLEFQEIMATWEKSGLRFPHLPTIEAQFDVAVWQLWEDGHISHTCYGNTDVYEMWEMWELDAPEKPEYAPRELWRRGCIPQSV